MVGHPSQGIRAIQGVTIQTMATGTLDANTPTAGRCGDLLVSTTTGKWYTTIPAITGASTDWALITSA
jgi:hypothetical protein